MGLMTRRAKLFNQEVWSDFLTFGTGAFLFYIKPGDNGVKYRFYDENYNRITDLQVGDQPVYYKMAGANYRSFDKYFVFNHYYIDGFMWAPNDKEEVTGANKTAIGTGRWNTNKIMSKSAYVNDTDTIWNKLKTWFLEESATGHCGCSDWYIPSSEELRILMSATKRDGSYIVLSRNDDAHSSTESTYYKCIDWLKADGTMGDISKFSYNHGYVIRSF